MPIEDVGGTLSALAKEMYDNEVGNTLMEGSSLWAEMPKDWNAGGRYLRVAVKYASTSGSGNDFAEAQAAHDEAQRVAFEVPFYDDFSLFRITDKAIAQCKGDKYALQEVLQEVGDDALDTIHRNMHFAMWRNGGASRGVIASGSSSDTLQLATPSDIVHFAPNMVIESYSDDGSTVTAGDGEYIRIASIDEDAGTITKSGADWDASGNFAANDHLFARGTIGKMVRGVSAWIPPNTTGLGTAFFNVTRSVAPNALAGVRLAAVAADGTIEAFLIRFAARLARNKGKPTHCYMNPVRFGQLVLELGDKCKYEQAIPKGEGGMPVMGHIGFEHIKMSVGTGIIKVFPEADVPYNLSYMLTMPTWKICGAGKPGVLNKDGLYMRALSNGAGYEGRFAAFWLMRCNAPGKNGVGDLSALPGAA